MSDIATSVASNVRFMAFLSIADGSYFVFVISVCLIFPPSEAVRAIK